MSVDRTLLIQLDYSKAQTYYLKIVKIQTKYEGCFADLSF